LKKSQRRRFEIPVFEAHLHEQLRSRVDGGQAVNAEGGDADGRYTENEGHMLPAGRLTDFAADEAH
jgi:hypothetical protein